MKEGKDDIFIYPELYKNLKYHTLILWHSEIHQLINSLGLVLQDDPIYNNDSELLEFINFNMLEYYYSKFRHLIKSFYNN